MISFKRIISIVALCLVFTLCLTGCGGASAAKTITTEADIIASNGSFLYRLVYDADLETASKTDDVAKVAHTEMNYVYQQIRRTFDIKVIKIMDVQAVADAANYEILVGETDRPESAQAMQLLRDNRENCVNDYLIKTIGNKICIVGGGYEALSYALRYFTTNFCLSLEGIAQVAGDFEYMVTPDYAISQSGIAGAALGDFKIVVPKVHTLLWTQAVKDFVSLLNEEAGVFISTVRDTEEPAEYEIIVGHTSRPESAPPEKGYVIKQSGTKLIVNGADDVQIAVALKELCAMAKEAADANQPLSIEAGFEKIGVAEKNSTDYYLSWHDEFDTLDRSIWVDFNSNPVIKPSTMGGNLFNGDARDVYVKDGSLYIPSFRFNKTDFQASQPTTNGTMAARYGIVEIYAKLPEYPVTTAFWANPCNYTLDESGNKVPYTKYLGPEIDLVETFGSVTQYACNVHNWFNGDGSDSNHTSLDGGKYGTAKKYKYTGEGDLSTDYHLYSMLWTPYEMTFAFDGEPYFTWDLIENTGTDFTRHPVYFLMGSSYAGVNYGPAYIEDDAPTESAIVADYFRIYQTDVYDSLLFVTPYKGEYVPQLPKETQEKHMKEGIYGVYY